MMGQHLTRRGVVKGLGLAPLAGIALPCSADASTPVMVEFAKYLPLTREIDACAGGLTSDGEQVLEPMFARCDQIEDRLMALPSLTAADFAAKVIVDTVQGCMFSDWDTGALWIEARALTGWGKP